MKRKEYQKIKDAFHTAIKSGKIKKEPCFVCGKEGAEGHHPDYSQPLKVEWLCQEHHYDRHGKSKKEKITQSWNHEKKRWDVSFT